MTTPPGATDRPGLVFLLARVPGRSRSVSVGWAGVAGVAAGAAAGLRLCRRLRRACRRGAGGLGRRSRFGRLRAPLPRLPRAPPLLGLRGLPLPPPCAPLPRAAALPRRRTGSISLSLPARAAPPRASALLLQHALARRLLVAVSARGDSVRRPRLRRPAPRVVGVVEDGVAAVPRGHPERRPGRASCAPRPAPPWSGRG